MKASVWAVFILPPIYNVRFMITIDAEIDGTAVSLYLNTHGHTFTETEIAVKALIKELERKITMKKDCSFYDKTLDNADKITDNSPNAKEAKQNFINGD